MICYLHVDCSQARYTKGKSSYNTGKSSRFAHHKSEQTDPTGFRFSCCFWDSVIPPSPYISSTATYAAGCFVRAQFFLIVWKINLIKYNIRTSRKDGAFSYFENKVPGLYSKLCWEDLVLVRAGQPLLNNSKSLKSFARCEIKLDLLPFLV